MEKLYTEFNHKQDAIHCIDVLLLNEHLNRGFYRSCHCIMCHAVNAILIDSLEITCNLKSVQ